MSSQTSNLPTEIYYARGKLYTGKSYVRSMMTGWISTRRRHSRHWDSFSGKFIDSGPIDWSKQNIPQVHRLAVERGELVWEDVTQEVFLNRMHHLGRQDEL